MANNRMWLRCGCGDEVFVAKYYPTITNGWFIYPGRIGALAAFLEQHSYCPAAVPTMYGNTSFTLRFEEAAA